MAILIKLATEMREFSRLTELSIILDILISTQSLDFVKLEYAEVSPLLFSFHTSFLWFGIEKFNEFWVDP